MEQLWINLPALAPDYSGVCSAMFDLQGISVIHDASGCTGNYTGYDEPRWYGTSSKVFCSGLREIDAVLGRDDKLIDNIIKAGKELNPKLYTVIGSPVPMVIGSDMKGIAHELEALSGVPSFGFDTNGLGLYNKGISEAMCALIQRFTKKSEEKVHRGINILGATPLDLSANSNADDLVSRLESWNFKVIGRLMMGGTVEQIEDLDKAQINLVITESGLGAAKLLERKYNIPYVVGMPLMEDTQVLSALEETLETQKSQIICDKAEEGEMIIVGEQVLANSIRRAILQRNPEKKIVVGTLCGLNKSIASEGDMNFEGEESLTECLNSNRFSVIIGDPLMKGLIYADTNMTLIELPHVALSSKLYWNDVPRFLSDDMKKIIEN